MNFGRKETRKKIQTINSLKSKYMTKVFLMLFYVVLLSSFLLITAGAFTGVGIIRGILDSTPEISIMDIAPSEFATAIYDSEGNLIETLVAEGSNREAVTYDQVPQDLINAVVAIEDERFWTHPGIDMKGIIRAGIKGLKSKDFNEGASTITQQLIKNSIFEGGAESSFGEKVERKLQEQYLALQIEKSMSKELILENYLNTINLGYTLGVQSAAKRYFNKDVWDLNLSECVVLAGITKNPSQYNPITHPEINAKRRLLVLNNMLRLGYITEEQKAEILADDVYDRIQTANAIYKEESSHYSYFTDELTEQIMKDLKEKKGYTENQAYKLLFKGGLSIYTTQNPRLQKIVDEEIGNPENYTLVEYSIAYRLSVQHSDGTEEHFSETDIKNYNKNILKITKFNALYKNQDEINQTVEAFKSYILKPDDKIIGESLTVTLQPQISFVLMDQSSGHVLAINGGRGEKTGSRTLNRATNTVRQPGSAFKTLVSFAPALDTSGATLGTVYYDAPYAVGEKNIRNWWSAGYLGYSNIRDGIIYSMNIVATKALMETVTPRLGFEYAENFGISTLVENEEFNGSVKSDLNASLALGGLTRGVHNIELTAAYAAIANGGVYTEPIFYTKILDHNGKVLLDNEPETHRVIKDSTAFLLTDALADSMESRRILARPGVSVSATSPGASIPNMSNAGKSGTTTANNDIWFVGFSPYYTAGIWSGYDENQGIPQGHTSFHKAIWRKIMTRAHEGLSDPGFQIPNSIESAAICKKSGKLAIEGVCELDPRGSTVYTEYFAKGTAPTEVCDKHTKGTFCRISNQPAGPYCPESAKETRIYMIVPEDGGTTDDSYFAMPSDISGTCSIHNPYNSSAPDDAEPDDD